MRSISALRGLLLILSPFLFVSASGAAPRLIAEQVAKPDSLAIPYQMYRLENGLILILHPDHSDPLVHVNVTYHVGSAREVQGMTGFAHFFEHMMFQGSKHVAAQQHYKMIEEAGGSLNGMTGQDITHYFESVPANELEKVLWLESDRMGFLLDAVSQKKFEIQRDTVKNERGQTVDNQPYGRVSEVLGESLYPRDHPYSWQPIGYIDDLNRVDVNDLKRFFLRWYGPNNATLTIGGDFKPEQALAWVERYFASIPAGPAVSKPPLQPVALERPRHVTYEDNIQLPLLLVTYPTAVVPGSEAEAALDIFADKLAGSKNSIFYQQLVKPGLALDASASFECSELNCNLQLMLQPNPQKLTSLKPLAEQAQQLLAGFAQQGITAADLARIKGIVRADTIWGRESVENKVNQLAYGQVLFGDPNAALHSMQRLNQVTAEQVLHAYQEHIAHQPALWLSVIPKGQRQWQLAQPDYQPAERKLVPYRQEAAPALRTVVDNFDRSRMPQSGPALVRAVPPLWKAKLTDRIEVWGSRNSEIPAVTLTITLPGGRRVESPQEAGLANLTALLVRQGTQRLSGEQLSEELQRLGSSISIGAGNYNTLITVSSLAENLPQTLTLVDELLNTPALRESDFVRIKNQLLQSLRQGEQEPGQQAEDAFYRQIYGASSPLSQPDGGYAATLERLTLKQVQAYYQRYYFPAGGVVVAVGDITQQRLLPQLAFLAQRKGEAQNLPSLKPSEPEAKPGIYLVDYPGAVQSMLRVGRRALPYDATGDYLLANLMNFNFAGNFNSRLNQTLREQKGYTYGASCGFTGNWDTGEFVCRSDVRGEATVDALRQLLRVMGEYRHSGPNGKELAYLKSAFLRQDALSYETLGQKANFLLDMAINKNSADYVLTQQAKVAAVSQLQLRQQAMRWLNQDQMIIVVVGDAKRLEKPLKALNLPLYRYSAPGATQG